jgi:hypothetical protein
MLVFFFELYSQENKFETWFEKKIMIFFLKGDLEFILFLGSYLVINWLNMI